MTKEHHDDLVREWSLYGPQQQKAIFEEFKTRGGNPASKEDFHIFLREKLEIDGYWKKAGLL